MKQNNKDRGCEMENAAMEDVKYGFTVNGVYHETEKEKPLLRYLRDDLRITSVKDGCSEGACGTCTVIVDGKATRSCILTTKRAVGKNIITIEGLNETEKEVYVYAAFVSPE